LNQQTRTEMTNYATIQMSKEETAIIYVVPTSQVTNFLDELVSKGVDISKAFLLKTDDVLDEEEREDDWDQTEELKLENKDITF